MPKKHLYPAFPDLPADPTPRPRFRRTWAFDFDRGDFVVSPTGRVKSLDGLDAYRQWCHKALMTPRLRYLIYSWRYGADLERLIGSRLSRGAIELEVQRMIKTTLHVNPLTQEVRGFRFTWQGSRVHVDFVVVPREAPPGTEIPFGEVIDVG